MQTSYSQNSIPIEEERRKLFKNVIKTKGKIDPMKLVGYLNSKHTRNSAKQAAKACLESDWKSTEDIKKTIQHSQSSEQIL